MCRHVLCSILLCAFIYAHAQETDDQAAQVTDTPATTTDADDTPDKQVEADELVPDIIDTREKLSEDISVEFPVDI
jgi:hypothetical protein